MNMNTFNILTCSLCAVLWHFIRIDDSRSTPGRVLMITIVKTLMAEEQQMTQEVKWSILQFSDICVSSVYLEVVIYEAEVSDVVERKPLLSD